MCEFPVAAALISGRRSILRTSSRSGACLLPMPDDVELDIQLPAGDIEMIEIRGAAHLKLHGAVTRYARIGSVTGTPSDPLGWLATGADAPLRQKGDYTIAHHFEPLPELAKTALFAAARNAVERTRINLVNIIKGETTTTADERRPKHKDKLAAIEAADART